MKVHIIEIQMMHFMQFLKMLQIFSATRAALASCAALPENDRIMIRANSCAFEKWCGLVFFMMWLLAACDVNLFMRSDATSQSWFCCLALNAPTIRVNTFREIQARTEPKVDFCLLFCSRIRSWCEPGPALVLLPDNGICICREFDFCNSINKPNRCWLLK